MATGHQVQDQSVRLTSLHCSPFPIVVFLDDDYGRLPFSFPDCPATGMCQWLWASRQVTTAWKKSSLPCAPRPARIASQHRSFARHSPKYSGAGWTDGTSQAQTLCFQRHWENLNGSRLLCAAGWPYWIWSDVHELDGHATGIGAKSVWLVIGWGVGWNRSEYEGSGSHARQWQIIMGEKYNNLKFSGIRYDCRPYNQLPVTKTV